MLFFQYDRCLLDQDIGKAAVQNAGKWTLTKSGLDVTLYATEVEK